MMMMMMKRVVLPFLAAYVSIVRAEIVPEDCSKCFDVLIEAQACLRECSNEEAQVNVEGLNFGIWFYGDDSGNLLNQCLDPERGGQPSIRLPPRIVQDKVGADGEPIDTSFLNETLRVDTMEDVANCCKMDDLCLGSLQDAQECMASQCVDPCVASTTRNYFECISQQASNDGCDSNSCLDGFFPAGSLPTRFGPTLELTAIQSAYEGLLQQTDLADCASLSPFVSQACSISDACCTDCDSQLAVTLDCLINDLVLPYTVLELNTTKVAVLDENGEPVPQVDITDEECNIGRTTNDGADPNSPRLCELVPSGGRPARRTNVEEDGIKNHRDLLKEMLTTKMQQERQQARRLDGAGGGTDNQGETSIE
ncbi:MAG: hypothetical protein SGARI_005045, partial [Bacillariaceae sp.]